MLQSDIQLFSKNLGQQKYIVYTEKNTSIPIMFTLMYGIAPVKCREKNNRMLCTCTVRNEMKWSGETEILHELVHDTTRISS